MKEKYLLFLGVVVLCACLGLSCVSAADHNLTTDNVNTTHINNSTSDVNLTSDNVNTTDIDNSTNDVNTTVDDVNTTDIVNATSVNTTDINNSLINATGGGQNKPFGEGYGHLQVIYGCMVAGAATGMVVGAYAGACVAGVPGAFILGMVGFSIGSLCGCIYGVIIVLLDIIFAS